MEDVLTQINGAVLDIKQLFFISTNEILRKTIEIWSKNMKFNTFTIDNLQEARHFFDDLKPDFLLLDCDDLLEVDILNFVGETSTQIPVVFLSEDIGKMRMKKPLEISSLLSDLESFKNKFKAH